MSVSVNVADARGLRFSCQPGCGFCCTANPLVQEREAPALGPLVVRADDGTLRIPIKGVACGALRADRMCGTYETRPSVCHLYPYAVHAGRRVQVTVSLGCPGVGESAEGEAAEEGAQKAAALALAQPGAAEVAARAKETFAEFDRRMKEWGVQASPDRLRSGFLPHVGRLSRPENLPVFFAGLEPGELLLEGSPAKAVEMLFDAEPHADLVELLAQAAVDAFDEPETVIWVEPDHAWTTVESGDEGTVRLLRQRAGAWDAPVELDVEEIPLEWDEAASAVLADYLRRLCHRDHTEAAAAWIVDASGYQATLPAAYGRVLGESALQVVLRAGLLAAEAGAPRVDAATARRGVAAYETAYHSLPTLGGIL